jgi:hypothetical protein
MGVIGRLGLAGVGVGLALAASAARAQGSCTFVDESGKTVTWPNCQPPADAKTPPSSGTTTPGATTPGTTTPAPAPGTSPAKSFPYPGDMPAPPAGAPSAPAGQDSGTQAGTPTAPPSAPAGNKFPYPGDDSAGGAGNPASAGGGTKPGPPNGDPLQDAGSSGSSSSSSSDSSSSGGGDEDPLAGDDDPAAKAAEARSAARKKLPAGPRLSPDERETEDLKVAAFYQNDGNFKGAYERATDAVSIAADDADAQLALADAARRLGKLDEAETHYKKCLTLDPVPKTRKAAEKALKEMMSGGV